MNEGRYEFRIFGDDLSETAERITTRSACSTSEVLVSDDCYILCPGNHAYIIKIRNGMLDVKQMIRCSGRLEQWQPLGKQPFPLSSEMLRTHLFSLLNLPLPKHLKSSYTPEALLELIAAHNTLSVASVHKERRRCTVGSVSCDLSRLVIGSKVFESICCESADPEALESLINTLRIETVPNENYLGFLNTFIPSINAMQRRNITKR